MARTGRRPGDSGARTAILDAARAAFAAHGYSGASIRAIAGAAEVDPALVHHYFGTKSELFAAAMSLPLDPSQVLPGVLAGDPAGAGERLVRFFLSVWEEPASRAPILALIRSALTHEDAAEMLRGYVADALVASIGQTVEGPEAELRATLAVAQLLGMAMGRYLLRVEPLVSADVETLVRRLAPVLQQHLTP